MIFQQNNDNKLSWNQNFLLRTSEKYKHLQIIDKMNLAKVIYHNLTYNLVLFKCVLDYFIRYETGMVQHKRLTIGEKTDEHNLGHTRRNKTVFVEYYLIPRSMLHGLLHTTV